MDSLLPFLEKSFLGITVQSWLTALGIIIAAWIVKRIFGVIYDRVLHSISAKTKNDYDDLIITSLQKPAEMLVFIGGLFLALQTLELPARPVNLQSLSHAMIQVLVTIAIARAFFNMAGIIDRLLCKRVECSSSSLDENLVGMMRKFLRGLIIFFAILMVIQNLGYSITGLLASLGIGGIAVAMAARDSIANIFGSLMIIFDRPFKAGDWILAGDIEGTVEEVGFRSTKIRTFAKTLITVPNNVIANMAVDNFSRMPKRRIKLNIGVTYDTTSKQMQTAVEKIRQLLKDDPAIDQEFFLVNFTDFGASSLDIMVYCFTTTTNWGEYLDARQALSLKIMETLEALGLEIAFPSRTVYLHESGESKPTGQ
ncbi:MAG: mechanosensitive ion channel family protein [Desulfuromonas sp.]|nr:MAG: mechanosensitive ion channel family protein [Desulfuromonas sp.]